MKQENNYQQVCQSVSFPADDVNIPPPPYEEVTPQPDSRYAQGRASIPFQAFYVPILDQSPFWEVQDEYSQVPSHIHISPDTWYTFMQEVKNKAQITSGFKVTKNSMMYAGLELLTTHSIRQSIWCMKCIDLQCLVDRWNASYFRDHGIQITLLQGDLNTMDGYMSSWNNPTRSARNSRYRLHLKIECL
ncbi:hypothetical protein K450DRAFT_226417 [Umbelopsis ramanniana AG]|uniref:Uncharacterized protein n=1 Tax=Umbelopsis ramanniana AG TaxID=1314678 RepID=A0AAD5EI17_UMBRA|nr:uncharacterized protein K450DRAFT_226417 [Umbelopsis ramanniana AG]KAI8582685.1 hypothetical protein K450DRAFT_226417 [Umbelopsis ramanniana AG]